MALPSQSGPEIEHIVLSQMVLNRSAPSGTQAYRALQGQARRQGGINPTTSAYHAP